MANARSLSKVLICYYHIQSQMYKIKWIGGGGEVLTTFANTTISKNHNFVDSYSTSGQLLIITTGVSIRWALGIRLVAHCPNICGGYVAIVSD